jgi:hypothetical protein
MLKLLKIPREKMALVEMFVGEKELQKSNVTRKVITEYADYSTSGDLPLVVADVFNSCRTSYCYGRGLDDRELREIHVQGKSK